MSSATNNIESGKEVLFDLGILVDYMLRQWKWFILFGFSFAIIFAFYSTKLPNEYTSEILLADAEVTGSPMDGISGQLGGLASLAGINMNSGKNKKLISLQLIKSRNFLIEFVKANQLEVELFAVKAWDKESGNYVYNEEVYNPKTQKWAEHPDREGTFYPTDNEIFEKAKSLIEVDVDKTNRVTKIFLTYYHPEKAQQWLTILVNILNQKMANADIAEKERQISFLQAQLDIERNEEIRNVYFSLIEEQIKGSTLAKARIDYIFKVIDPAMYPEVKSGPKRALIAVLGGLVGGFLCFIIFTLAFIFKPQKA